VCIFKLFSIRSYTCCFIQDEKFEYITVRRKQFNERIQLSKMDHQC